MNRGYIGGAEENELAAQVLFEVLIFTGLHPEVQLAGDSGAHFIGGHIGKGQDKDVPDVGAGAGCGYGVDATAGKHGGLACPGRRGDKDGPRVLLDGTELLRCPFNVLLTHLCFIRSRTFSLLSGERTL